MQIFNRHQLEIVFTPSSVAKLTYVKRSTLESDVEKFLQIPGMQVILYGHSGCGKSTLVINKLDKLKIKYIKTNCEGKTTLDELVARAFDALDVFYVSERTHKFSSQIGSKLIGKYKAIKAELSASAAEEQSNKQSRVLPVLLNAQRLAEFLGAINCVWVIEDFHKVNILEKKRIADVLKVFMDASANHPNAKIVCIGAVGTAREMVELDSNLSTRVAEISVPVLDNNELDEIVKTGFKLLNISCPNQIDQKVVHYSNRLASVCHQLCYDICFDIGVKKTAFFTAKPEDIHFTRAVHAYVRKNSDTMSKTYEKAVASEDRKSIIRQMIQIQKDQNSFSEICPPSFRSNGSDKIQNAVDQLLSADCGEILRFDQNSQKYSFSSPFFLVYAKMRLAIEAQERKERIERKNRSNFHLSSSRHIQFDEEELGKMIDEMSRIYARHQADIKKMIDDEKKLK